MIEVREAVDGPDMQAALKLRHDVFVGEQGVSEDEECDGRDGQATHFVACLPPGRGAGGERVVGTCRVLVDPLSGGQAGATVRLGRLAVDAAARRRGAATALLARAEAWARERGAAGMVLAAQTDARPLYERAGYEPRGELFMEAGIEHVMMHKPLV